MNSDIILGKSNLHLVPLEGTKFLLHKEIVSPFLNLQESAIQAGFDLQITSAFRDYERQLKIWNAKAKGERILIDEFGSPLIHQVLTPDEIMFSILRWSALPGASRHHWGTDIDVFNGNTQSIQDVKLTPQECEIEGPAFELHQWLDEQILNGKSFGFYRPYAQDLGGVSPERWHLSYAPIASQFESELDLKILESSIQNSNIELKNIILENLDLIYKKYITNVSRSPF